MERTQKKSLLGWLDKICRCSMNTDVEQDVHRQEIIITILMLTGSVVITGLSLWDMIEGAGPHWGNEVTLAVGLLATMSYIVMLITSRLSLFVTLVLMVFLHFFWLITSGVELAGMFWCLVMLPLFFYLLGHKQGGALVIVVFILSAIVLLQPSLLALPTSYSTHISYRFLLAYLVLFWVSFLVERVRFQIRYQLEEARDNLNVQARTDELTGLANRRGFKQYLGSAEKRNKKETGLFSVIVGDLDHFKLINDAYSHDVGDCVLREVAKTLKASARAEDLIVRWGGEEFLLLLADTDLVGAHVLAEKMRQKIASTRIVTEEGKLAVTMSFGVDTQPAGGDLYSTLGAADKAMYEAKRRGRNCVVTAEENDNTGCAQTELNYQAEAE